MAAYELVKTFSQPPVIEHGGITPKKCSTDKYVASAKPSKANKSTTITKLLGSTRSGLINKFFKFII